MSEITHSVGRSKKNRETFSHLTVSRHMASRHIASRNMANRHTVSRLAISAGAIWSLGLTGMAQAGEPLFVERVPAARAALGVAASESLQAQAVRLNRRALNGPEIDIDLFGETVTAVRTRVERRAGEQIWVGHIVGNETDDVILTWRAGAVSGRIQYGERIFRIGAFAGTGRNQGASALIEIDPLANPVDDAGDLPSGGGVITAGDTALASAGDLVRQDLLVVYTNATCTYFGSCADAESAISTAVADINTAYLESGVMISMNLVGTHLTDYVDGAAGDALNHLRIGDDGFMDEIHPLRDELGADIVAMVFDGSGCGIGYVGSSASTAFSVTDAPCLVGNRTMAHEIGHNQGALHDRQTHSGGNEGAYNYGYRRCSDGSVDDFGAPYFRTIMSYGCASASRVGRLSNPDVSFNGVPQGVDPDLDPVRGAFNVRVLNESASHVAGFRAQVDTPETPPTPTPTPTPTPPVAPSGLVASATGSDTVALSWSDNASDEDSYHVQSSTDGTTFSTIAQLGANETSFIDNGLNPDTTYFYRVFAMNSAGASSLSGVASATTNGVSAVVEDRANGEIVGAGLVSGTFQATHFDDGVAQRIDEQSTGGPKRSRAQFFSHQWTFNVVGGVGGVMVEANAWVSGSEGALFDYSLNNGASWSPLFVVTENDPSTVKSALLPDSASGSVRIRARDAEQASGEGVDTLRVDQIKIISATTLAPPPAAPANLVVSDVTQGAVSLTFTDNADNEFGFAVRRSTGALASCGDGEEIDILPANDGLGAVGFTDGSAAPSTTYWYAVTAFNSGGDNGTCAISPAVTTPAGPALGASALGYKNRGAQIVDVSWSPATTNVEIYRDGVLLGSGANGSYTDNINAKGGGSYRYDVCVAGSSRTSCAAPVTVIF